MFSGLATGAKLLGYQMSRDEVLKKVGCYVFDDSVTGGTSHTLNSIAALTFSDKQCEDVYKLLAEGMNPDESTVITMEKTLNLVRHLVIHGAERCVDAAWKLYPQIEELLSFNTAIRRGSLHTLIGGGVDSGGPVRAAAAAVKDLLDDEEAVRTQRKAKADPTTLLPLGSKDDFLEPAEVERRARLAAAGLPDGGAKGVGSTTGGFGSAGQSIVIGATYTLEDMMKLAEANAKKPEKYRDPWATQLETYSDVKPIAGPAATTTTKSLDSDYTRQKLAPDLLSFDFVAGGVGKGADLPNHDLVAMQKERELKDEIKRRDSEIETLRQVQQQFLAQQQQQQILQQAQQMPNMMMGGGMMHGGMMQGGMMQGSVPMGMQAGMQPMMQMGQPMGMQLGMQPMMQMGQQPMGMGMMNPQQQMLQQQQMMQQQMMQQQQRMMMQGGFPQQQMAMGMMQQPQQNQFDMMGRPPPPSMPPPPPPGSF
jgi:hypothetical protein